MAREKTKKEPKELILLPEGRLLNNALFERDQYDDAAKPMYKIEVAIPKSAEKEFDDLVNRLYEEAEKNGLPSNEKFTIDGGDAPCGIIDGDEYAKKRERQNKPADAYKDHWIIRAASLYNKDGNEGPGGMAVYDEDGKEVTIQTQSKVYNGCYGFGCVTLGTYTDDGKNGSGLTAVKFYLAGFQKSKDGEKFSVGRDLSSVFKPLGRKSSGENADAGSRRRR
jgi:hypothetical protein